MINASDTTFVSTSMHADDPVHGEAEEGHEVDEAAHRLEEQASSPRFTAAGQLCTDGGSCPSSPPPLPLLLDWPCVSESAEPHDPIKAGRGLHDQHQHTLDHPQFLLCEWCRGSLYHPPQHPHFAPYPPITPICTPTYSSRIRPPCSAPAPRGPAPPRSPSGPAHRTRSSSPAP